MKSSIQMLIISVISSTNIKFSDYSNIEISMFSVPSSLKLCSVCFEEKSSSVELFSTYISFEFASTACLITSAGSSGAVSEI